MKTWSQARGRFEAEVQRRKEHLNFATNFAEARGFVRTKWKSKNFNPENDPTQFDSSSESDPDNSEERDKVFSDSLTRSEGDDIDEPSRHDTEIKSPTSLSLAKRRSIDKLRRAITKKVDKGEGVLEAIDLTNKCENNPHDNARMSTNKLVATCDAI